MYSIETFDLFIFHENIEYNMMLLILSFTYTSIRLKTPSYNTNHTSKYSTEVVISNDVCIDLHRKHVVQVGVKDGCIIDYAI